MGVAGRAQAVPTGNDSYSRRNTFSVFAEYSNDSSHIILGVTPNRKLGALGVQYERRLIDLHVLRLAYIGELRPFVLSSDPAETDKLFSTTGTPPTTSPVGVFTSAVLRCEAGTSSVTITDATTGAPITLTNNVTCSRQHTFAQGGSPVGLRVNLRPRKPLQLTLSANGGYLFSTKAIPIPDAGSFNFTFEFGGGLEYFYAPRRSARLEYVIQHYSNHYTAPENPGVDSGFLKVTYAFGR